MNKDVLMKINGKPVYWDGEVISYHGEMTCCADGSPRCYGPAGCSPEPLDYLGNAGSYETGWWGIVTDNNGTPIFQQPGHPEKHPFPGLYISCTAYKHAEYPKEDCRAWVDAEKVKFSVIPSSVRMAVNPKFLGCRATITDQKTHQSLEVVCCEIGPSHHLGEASMAVCAAFGLNSDPKTGGSCDKKRWLYKFYPGVPAPGWTLI
jgi:hypothetical protein